MAEEWYYLHNSKQVGPVPTERLIQLIKEGQLRGSDEIWKFGTPDWMPIRSVPTLAVLLPGAQTVLGGPNSESQRSGATGAGSLVEYPMRVQESGSPARVSGILLRVLFIPVALAVAFGARYLVRQVTASWFSNREAVAFYEAISDHDRKVSREIEGFTSRVELNLAPILGAGKNGQAEAAEAWGPFALKELTKLAEDLQHRMDELEKDLNGIKPSSAAGSQDLKNAYFSYFTMQKEAVRTTSAMLFISRSAILSSPGPPGEGLMENLQKTLRNNKKELETARLHLRAAEKRFAERNRIRLVELPW